MRMLRIRKTYPTTYLYLYFVFHSLSICPSANSLPNTSVTLLGVLSVPQFSHVELNEYNR